MQKSGLPGAGLDIPDLDPLGQGCPVLLLEGQRPADFNLTSSTTLAYTFLITLISWSTCV